MIEIIVISHGPMAHAIIESAEFFLGKINHITWLELAANDNPEDFGVKIQERCQQLNCKDGVIILADLFGGTPCNQACLMMKENLHVISGLNLSMLLEICMIREQSELNLDALVATVREGICYMNHYQFE